MPRHSPDTPKVSSLTYYPVKSCMGIGLTSAQIDERGIKDDRGWLVIGEDNVAVTQRDAPAMCHISSEIVADTNGEKRSLLLRAPQMPDLLVPEIDLPYEGFNGRGSGGGDSNGEKTRVKGENASYEPVSVTVWDDRCQAVNQGPEASEWLSTFLRHKVKLVRMSRDNVRKVPLKKKESFEGVVGFADLYPFLVVSTASLEDLNSRLKEPVGMDRFRPNIVIDGVEPFAEDTWVHIKIGDIRFAIDKPCARCVIVTIDQKTAQKAKEPLATLATYRRENDKVMFGQNAVHDKIGSIKVGDPVEILKVR